MSRKLLPQQQRDKDAAKERRGEARSLRAAGFTYQQIANMWGVSRQRIHQILKWERGYRQRLKDWKQRQILSK